MNGAGGTVGDSRGHLDARTANGVKGVVSSVRTYLTSHIPIL